MSAFINMPHQKLDGPPPHTTMMAPSPPRNGENHAAAAAGGGGRETFAKFFECWLAEQSRDLDALRSAAAAGDGADEAQLRRLVDQVVGHYEYYYNAKAAAAAGDVLPMFSPSWTSSTENLFRWAGGWRPTAALHLLYSKAGLQLQDQLPRILQGRRPDANLAHLSPSQLERIDALQRSTIRREREISEEEAAAQEAVAAARVVDIAGGGGGREEEMEREMREKGECMRKVLEKAVRLRLDTIKAVVRLLRPAQAAHFLIAAAELLLAVHEFGRKKDEETAS